MHHLDGVLPPERSDNDGAADPRPRMSVSAVRNSVRWTAFTATPLSDASVRRRRETKSGAQQVMRERSSMMCAALIGLLSAVADHR